MKKLVGVALAGLIAFALVGGPATAAPKQQHVEGTIAVRAPFVSNTEQFESCYSGVHRRLFLAAGEQARGIVGWDFEVDPATYNKPFKLEVTGGTAIDLDLTFYMNGLGSVQDHIDNPPWGQTLATVDFKERNTEGESGIVPKGATHAIVCMFDGSQSSFMYMAGKGVK